MDLLKSFREEKRRLALEGALPAALLQCAGLPPGAGVEQLLKMASGQKALEEPCRKALDALENGASVPTALEVFRRASRSPLADKVASLWLEAHRTGSDFGLAFRETAEALFETQAIERERAAAGALQRYTILAAVLLVPLVLGLVLNVVVSLQADWGGLDLEGGMSQAQRAQLFQAVQTGILIYIGVFAIVSSVFLALQSGKPATALLYCLALLPVCFAVLQLVRGFSLL